jgi:hypothetical protein
MFTSGVILLPFLRTYKMEAAACLKIKKIFDAQLQDKIPVYLIMRHSVNCAYPDHTLIQKRK